MLFQFGAFDLTVSDIQSSILGVGLRTSFQDANFGLTLCSAFLLLQRQNYLYVSIKSSKSSYGLIFYCQSQSLLAVMTHAINC